MPSYSPVFSQGFIYYTPDTPNSTFDVPTGFTAVIRDVECSCEAGGSLFQIFAANAAGASAYTIQYLTVGGLTTSARWEGRVVVPGGGVIAVSIADLSVNPSCYVGGYLLRNELT